MAPPKNNANRMIVGDRSGLAVPELCAALEPAGKRARIYRSNLEEAVIQAKKIIGIDDTHAINSATRCELIVLACAHRIRTKADAIDDSHWLALLDRIGKFTLHRDQAVRALGIGKIEPPDIFAGVFDALPPASRVPVTPNGSQPVASGNAPQAKPSDSEADAVHPDYHADDEAGT